LLQHPLELGVHERLVDRVGGFEKPARLCRKLVQIDAAELGARLGIAGPTELADQQVRALKRGVVKRVDLLVEQLEPALLKRRAPLGV
jgi:hypothetical protein